MSAPEASPNTFNTLRLSRIKYSRYDEWVKESIQKNARVGRRLTVYKAGEGTNFTYEDREILRRLGTKVAACSTMQWWQTTPDQARPAQILRCDSRWCPICVSRRSRKWQDKLAAWTGEHGQTIVDGNGKLKGDETREEALARLEAELGRIVARLPEGPDRTEAIVAATERAERSLLAVEGRLQHHFITLTIPNVVAVWDAQKGRAVLDAEILIPFRAMMTAIKNRRNRYQKRTSRRATPIPTRRTMRHAIRRATRRPYAWKRPRGRHFVLGVGYLGSLIGYLAALEVTHHPDTGYHPHIHILSWSRRPYIAQGILRHVWRHFAKNPRIKAVNIKKANPVTITKELIKYVTKAQKTTGPALKQIARALYRRRALWTGGIAYGVRWSRVKREQQLDRAAEAPDLAPVAKHWKVRWNAKKRGFEWTELPLAAPLKTSQAWAQPTDVTPDGEILRPGLAKRFAARRTASTRPHRRASTWEKRGAYWKTVAQAQNLRIHWAHEQEGTN